jgi:hypothetical protein
MNNVSGCGTSSTGTLHSGPGSNQCQVDLAGISNQQSLTLTLNNVIDSENNSGAVSITMGVLLGDVNGSNAVNAGDIAFANEHLGQTVDATNFRADVDANGAIDAADVSTIKSSLGTGLQ